MKMGKKKEDNCYLIAYYLPNKNNEKVKILDEYFIRKNRNKCKIIYKNKIYEIKEYFEDIYINYNHKDKIKLKLIFIHNIIGMSNIFYNCISLKSLSFNKKTHGNDLFFPKYIINICSIF